MSTNQETVSNPVEDALRVMGAEMQSECIYYLPRTCANVLSDFPTPYDQALFIHESRLYFQEQGVVRYEIRRLDENVRVWLVVHDDAKRKVHQVFGEGANECEAYAKAVIHLAVLSTVPPQVGEVKG